jgi:hypothetical protein
MVVPVQSRTMSEDGEWEGNMKLADVTDIKAGTVSRQDAG